MQISVALTGDRRLTENLIHEVRAVAERYGLAVPSIEIVSQPRGVPKSKRVSDRKSK
jgi:hypothetical protein